MENGPSTASLAHFSYLFVGLHPDQRFFKALFGGLGYVALGNHHEVRDQLSLAVHRGPVSGQHYIQRLDSNISRADASFPLDRLVVEPHIGYSLVDAVFDYPAGGHNTSVTSVLIQYHRKCHRSGDPKDDLNALVQGSRSHVLHPGMRPHHTTGPDKSGFGSCRLHHTGQKCAEPM